jgi:hypothetical protein
VPKGLPHSVFLGRVVGPADPMWTDADRDKALAYERAMADLCPSCRTRMSVWEQERLSDTPPYVGQQRRCDGCQALRQEEDNVPQGQRAWVHAYLAPTHLVDDPGADVIRGR